MINAILWGYVGGCLASYRHQRTAGRARHASISASLAWPWLWISEWLEDRRARAGRR